MNLIPRCNHGPFCSGAPMHMPLLPTNAIERWLIRYVPPLTLEQSRRVYEAHIRSIKDDPHA